MTKEELLQYGISKTVYGLVYPETRSLLEKVLQNENFQDLFEEAYTSKQDIIHETFFDEYESWLNPYVILGKNFKFRYPTSGSSEAIRESIAYLTTSNNLKKKVHMFYGEYEGYDAYAAAHRVTTIKHNRDDYYDSLKNTFEPGDLFYISQPSSIDGNYWKEFNQFILYCKYYMPEVKIMVDLAYIGTTPDIPPIDLTHENISGVFISLSKAFGTYYYRIGGMLSRSSLPGLYGNMWFKSIPSLICGTELMKKFLPWELPKKYLYTKNELLKQLVPNFGEDITSSDSLLIATQKITEKTHPSLKEALGRGNQIRYCLTPGIDRIIKC